jgi:cytochrome P450
MNIHTDELARSARETAYSLPLEDINPAQPALFESDTHWPTFERLRKEDPVHYTRESAFGPYWSITKYNDIMAVDTNHQVFSSERGITIGSSPEGEGPLPMFIAMDPPKHDVQKGRHPGGSARQSLAA